MRRVFELDLDRASPYTTGFPFLTGRIFAFNPAMSICFFTIFAQSSIPSLWAETLGCFSRARKSCRKRSLFFETYCSAGFSAAVGIRVGRDDGERASSIAAGSYGYVTLFRTPRALVFSRA